MRITLTLLILSFLCVETASAKPFAYITNNGSQDVSVIDIETNKVVDRIHVGAFPFGVAISPGGAFVYVTQGHNTVSVIDTKK